MLLSISHQKVLNGTARAFVSLQKYNMLLRGAVCKMRSDCFKATRLEALIYTQKAMMGYICSDKL